MLIIVSHLFFFHRRQSTKNLKEKIQFFFNFLLPSNDIVGFFEFVPLNFLE